MRLVEAHRHHRYAAVEVLESYLSDLRMEIAGTDSVSFRENLKKTEAFLKGLLTRLHEPR